MRIGPLFRDAVTTGVQISATHVAFDTLGDSQPGGVFVSVSAPELHGSLETADLDFCDIAEMFTG